MTSNSVKKDFAYTDRQTEKASLSDKQEKLPKE